MSPLLLSSVSNRRSRQNGTTGAEKNVGCPGGRHARTGSGTVVRGSDRSRVRTPGLRAGPRTV